MSILKKLEELFRIARVISYLIRPESSHGKMLYRNPCQIFSMIRDGMGHYIMENNEPVSFCGWYEYDGFIEVGSTITDPANRGKGLATECLYRVLHSIQHSGKQIIAFCNNESKGLFAKAGFDYMPKTKMPEEAMLFCSECEEYGNFPDCHCSYMVFNHRVAQTKPGVWHTVVENPLGELLNACATAYCQVWAEPPWDEYEWDLDEVEEELGQASNDPATLFFTSLYRGKVNGFSAGYPIDKDGMRAKAGGNQLDHLFHANPLLFYIAELGVVADSRYLGAGKMLSRHLLDAAENRGFTRFVLRTDVEAHPARALYKSLGFTDNGIADSRYPTRTYWVRDAD